MLARSRFDGMTRGEGYVLGECLEFGDNENMKAMHRQKLPADWDCVRRVGRARELILSKHAKNFSSFMTTRLLSTQQ